VRAVDTLDVKHFVMDLAKRFHILLREDIAVLGGNGYPHRIPEVGEVIAVREHVLNIRMPQRNHLLEAGRRPYLGSLVKQKYADQQADQDHRRPIVEYQTLQYGRRLLLVLGHGCSGLLFSLDRFAPEDEAVTTPLCPTRSRLPCALATTPDRERRSGRL